MIQSCSTQGAGFFEAMLDSLDHQIAALDESGNIICVNQAWIDFGARNGVPADFDWLRKNYLDVCAGAGEPSPQILATAEGVRDVVTGGLDVFETEYPCHSPVEQRWFLMRITAMRSAGRRRCVVSHTNITGRKLAEQAAEALSVTDFLTGLANRRRLDRFLRDEWRRALRQRRPLSLSVIDVDHFKILNDTLGHSAGDVCLRQVAGILGQCARRPTDLAARLGGEEFVVVLADTTLDGAVVVANRIRESVAELDFRFGDAGRLTVSAGVSFTYPDRDGDGACLLKQADDALYQAKRNGRNRVETFAAPRAFAGGEPRGGQETAELSPVSSRSWGSAGGDGPRSSSPGLA